MIRNLARVFYVMSHTAKYSKLVILQLMSVR